jgi:hypothetical protein
MTISEPESRRHDCSAEQGGAGCGCGARPQRRKATATMFEFVRAKRTEAGWFCRRFAKKIRRVSLLGHGWQRVSIRIGREDRSNDDI